MKKNNTISFILIVVSLITIISSLTFLILNQEKDENEKKESNKVEKIYVNLEDNKPLENFNKKSAVKAMEELLVSARKDIDGKDRSVDERLIALNNEKTDMKDVLSEETISKLHMSTEFDNLLFNRQFTATSILTYVKLIEEVTKTTEISSSKAGLDDLVYFDEKLRTVHIPIDVFTGVNRGISFELNYIDGEWKFTPYTSMMSLVMMVNYEERLNEELQK